MIRTWAIGAAIFLTACGREQPPREPLETAKSTAPPSAVETAGCAGDDSLLAGTAGPEIASTLAAARAPADSRERRAARLSVARSLMKGERGVPKDARRAFCLLRPLYDAGVLAAAGDLGDLNRDAGQLERAAQLYGVDFGSGWVNDRERPVRGSLPEVGASHRAWVRMHDLVTAHPDQRESLERAFREGARAGYGQERTARDSTRG
jgi:hypothetical protein